MMRLTINKCKFVRIEIKLKKRFWTFSILIEISVCKMSKIKCNSPDHIIFKLKNSGLEFYCLPSLSLLTVSSDTGAKGLVDGRDSSNVGWLIFPLLSIS